MDFTIHFWPALASLAIALVALLLIVAALIIRQHAQDVAQSIAEQPDEHEVAP